jgi:hypothetical protein
VIYKPVNAPELFDKIGKYLGVRYEYRALDVLGGDAAERYPVALTPDDLSVLPVEWLREFSRTLRRGRSPQLLALIDRLPPGRQCRPTGWCRHARYADAVTEGH